MSPYERDRAYIEHMLECIERIEKYVGKGGVHHHLH